MQGSGSIIGKPAPDFTLKNEKGEDLVLSQALRGSSTLLVFYPGDFTPVCTKQLCNYRDNIEGFLSNGIKLIGISANSVESHADFKKKYDLPFMLLSDPDKSVAKAYGCTSLMMFGGVSRAVCIVNKKMILLYRYVESTILTRRKADELVQIIEDLKAHSLL